MTILPIPMLSIIWINSFEIVFGAIVIIGISLAEMIAVETSEKTLI